MSKHTPGPWKYMPDDGGGPVGCVIGKTGWVCDYLNDPKPADARLIAAAPDLLKALILAASHVHTLTTPRAKADYSLIRAAIAKATKGA
jgi:hypothetical protein